MMSKFGGIFVNLRSLVGILYLAFRARSQAKRTGFRCPSEGIRRPKLNSQIYLDAMMTVILPVEKRCRWEP
ncbi:hypothetical protein F5146DRAFT_1060304 [Armillaria mellea]|nr:hypothetical protein F5146DRAFT_1060304 [Armillaria mellea]